MRCVRTQDTCADTSHPPSRGALPHPHSRCVQGWSTHGTPISEATMYTLPRIMASSMMGAGRKSSPTLQPADSISHSSVLQRGVIGGSRPHVQAGHLVHSTLRYGAGLVLGFWRQLCYVEEGSINLLSNVGDSTQGSNLAVSNLQSLGFVTISALSTFCIIIIS